MKSVKRTRKGQGAGWKWLGYVVLYLGTLGGVCALGWSAYRHLIGNPQFRISQVLIEGASPFVRSQLAVLADSSRHQNIFLADLAPLRAEIEGVSWVEEALVRRELPNRLRILVRERERCGLVARGEGLTVVDRHGELLGLYHPEQGLMDVPILTGLEQGTREQISRALAIAEEIRQGNLYFWSHLDRLDFSNPRNTVAWLAPFPGAIHLGDQVLQENLDRFLRLADYLEKTYPAIQHVELGFAGQISILPQGEDG